MFLPFSVLLALSELLSAVSSFIFSLLGSTVTARGQKMFKKN